MHSPISIHALRRFEAGVASTAAAQNHRRRPPQRLSLCSEDSRVGQPDLQCVTIFYTANPPSRATIKCRPSHGFLSMGLAFSTSVLLMAASQIPRATGWRFGPETEVNLQKETKRTKPQGVGTRVHEEFLTALRPAESVLPAFPLFPSVNPISEFGFKAVRRPFRASAAPVPRCAGGGFSRTAAPRRGARDGWFRKRAPWPSWPPSRR